MRMKPFFYREFLRVLEKNVWILEWSGFQIAGWGMIYLYKIAITFHIHHTNQNSHRTNRDNSYNYHCQIITHVSCVFILALQKAAHTSRSPKERTWLEAQLSVPRTQLHVNNCTSKQDLLKCKWQSSGSQLSRIRLESLGISISLQMNMESNLANLQE